ncbi:MAG: UDP-3-O-(3-hydroxymyristoyl)glucosamine N-acyltransferase [Pseudomonadota bacterium]
MLGGLRLKEIVARLGGVLLGNVGDDAILITQVASLASAKSGHITFLTHPKYLKQLQLTQASAVIVPPKLESASLLPRIVDSNPYLYYARLVALLNPPSTPSFGVHHSAVCCSDIPDSVFVAEHVSIGRDVHLGEHVFIHAGCVIGDGVSIGSASVLHPNVVIYPGCSLGNRTLIHSGAVIGSDGFGFAKDQEAWTKISQIGRVLIGDDVEVGAHTSIDRGALDDTVIANGVKLDNQIQIAHNVQIGEHTAIAACVGIAGSTKIGRRCTIGGAAMIIGHLTLADDVHISAGSMVTKNLPKAGHYTSIFPLDTHDSWLRNAAQIKRLSKLAERVAELEEKLKSMERAN